VTELQPFSSQRWALRAAPSSYQHEFEAYLTEGSTPAKATVVIVHEIFGVTGHIRSVADDYASQGYFAVAAALFDRVERNLELGGMWLPAKHAAERFGAKKLR
jgi:dienelactone hydrolase